MCARTHTDKDTHKEKEAMEGGRGDMRVERKERMGC